ncbi:MAG TPA: acyl-homoserine-lactone synthase [Rudaea sp.]|nr:acyl-homoserine-lactone synthase [Rudaea sp.]
MLNIEIGTSDQLQAGLESDLAVYRHKVFVEQLGWELPAEQPGFERDQFDRADTVYVVARDSDGHICGCARLLSTEQAYLLATVFPGLLGGQAAPCSAEVWELSRYTTQVVQGDPGSRGEARERFGILLKGVVETALAKGARRLITFSYIGVERIARNFGLHVHRAGAPQLIDAKPVLAFWIELDEQTCTALGIAVANCASTL